MSGMKTKEVPDWITCPPATTSSSVWSMAVTENEAIYNSVLALSIKVYIYPYLHCVRASKTSIGIIFSCLDFK